MMNPFLSLQQDLASQLISPFLNDPTRDIFLAKNSVGKLRIHIVLRASEEIMTAEVVKAILDAAAQKGLDVIKEMLEAAWASGENCLMIALSHGYSFAVIALFLEYCKKYADIDKILHQRNSDGRTALAIITCDSPNYHTLHRLRRLVSYFPTQQSFDKALATHDKNQRSALDLCGNPACSELLSKPDCWKACCDFRLRFGDDTYNDVWQIRELVKSDTEFLWHEDAMKAAFLNLKDDNFRRKALSTCVEPYGFNMLQEACRFNISSKSLQFLLDSAVELGIVQELLEAVTPEQGNCLRICFQACNKMESFQLIMLYYRKYTNLPQMLTELDADGRTSVTWICLGSCFKRQLMELLIASFSSERVFQKLVKKTDFNLFEENSDKANWEWLNHPGFWRRCRKSVLMNFYYHALEMRDILQRFVKSGNMNQKLQKILSSDHTERVKETLTVKDRKGFNMFHSLCCQTLQKKTLKLFLDAAVRVGAIKEVLESRNGVNGENCLMLASGWFTVESFRLLAEFYEKHTDIKAVFRQKNDRGYDSISLVALRAENSLEFVKICLAQLPSDEVCREILGNRSSKLDLVLPLGMKDFLEEVTMRDDCCWQECRDVWLKMKDDDEAQEEEEEEGEEEVEEEEEEQVDEEDHDAVESEEEEEEEEPSPLKDILDFIASSLRQHTNDEHRVALETFCDSINVIKKVSVGPVVKYEEENE